MLRNWALYFLAFGQVFIELSGGAMDIQMEFRRSVVQNLSGGNHVTHFYRPPVLFSGIQHLLAISFSRVKFFAILVVANFANINSNE